MTKTLRWIHLAWSYFHHTSWSCNNIIIIIMITDENENHDVAKLLQAKAVVTHLHLSSIGAFVWSGTADIDRLLVALKRDSFGSGVRGSSTNVTSLLLAFKWLTAGVDARRRTCVAISWRRDPDCSKIYLVYKALTRSRRSWLSFIINFARDKWWDISSTSGLLEQSSCPEHLLLKPALLDTARDPVESARG